MQSSVKPNVLEKDTLASDASSDGSGIHSSIHGWYTIRDVGSLDPFLVSLASADDHWTFVSSNGGITAGRRSPAHALFPYLTEDKLKGLAHNTGPLTRIRWTGPDGTQQLWRPFDPDHPQGTRALHKSLDGTRIAFEEDLQEAGLRIVSTWGASHRFGFIRKVRLSNKGSEALQLDIWDGIQNINPGGISELFQSQFGILGAAYTRAELLKDSRLRLIYLNSTPTDRAEPSESLLANTVWSCGLQATAQLITTRQLRDFCSGLEVQEELESRGAKAGAFDVATVQLQPGQSIEWYWVAEVSQSTARCNDLHRMLLAHPEQQLAAMLEQDWNDSAEALRRLLARADALQHTEDAMRCARHYSNTLFNCMRGGIFDDASGIPIEAVRRHLGHFNPAAAKEFENHPLASSDSLSRDQILQVADSSTNPHLARLLMEFLPLTFSRRHGDPSRPWNRFDIKIRDNAGQRLLAYEGNWRDIFQNLEALLYSFPNYAEGVVCRFLNATTADGYNPYRINEKGFEWEELDPEEPWSNIGYWGDHQIVYLYRLLKTSRAFAPERLDALLNKPVFGYANVPYRIKSFDEVLKDPRNSIDYDDAEHKRIHQRIGQLGMDGKLLFDQRGEIQHVNLLEKLLVPLLAKVANLVPQGGIWMNTQRPEWNDANNALAGYGLSVVTMAYCYRYVSFLSEWWGGMEESSSVNISSEVIAWMAAQSEILAIDAKSMDPASRAAFVAAMGEAGDLYRKTLYNGGLSGEATPVAITEILGYLDRAKVWLANGLRANLREDRLYHSYNLLTLGSDGGIRISYLDEMLEGQVAILSSGILNEGQSIALMEAMRSSRLYRKDQDSYMLYPDKSLPGFLDKNTLPADALTSQSLLRQLAAEGGLGIIESDASGTWHFGKSFRNSAGLRDAIKALPAKWATAAAEGADAACNLFEELFNHHAFTGRSGTFFAYEGLGSIYWHMVSKLVLAIQECAIDAALREPPLSSVMISHYRKTLAGLGIHKTPELYGAFPLDAYSHTPKHAGAQQPGMTGQVKEDLLIRLGELGLRIHHHKIEFDPLLIDANEFLKSPSTFTYVDLSGVERALVLRAGSLAFTFCQVPIIYHMDEEAQMEIECKDGTIRSVAGSVLPADAAADVFARNGNIRCIRVFLSVSGQNDA